MTSSANKIDVAVVGGGIVGLWSAYTILKKYPNLMVVVFESENYFGEHTSGRNSEVLHSGLYYENNSLKHRSCLEGNQLWREYVSRKNLPFLNCGKVIISRSNQLDKMEQLFKRGIENDILGIRRLSASELKNLQQNLHLEDGFFIASSGVLNVSESINSLRNDIEDMGGVVLKNNKVSFGEKLSNGFLLNLNNDIIETQKLVNAAGLFAVEFRKQLGLTGFENYLVKGSYLKIKKNLDLNQLIYPIPPANGLGLGVHLTLDTAGGQKFGPDTEEVSSIDYSVNEVTKNKLISAIQENFKNINEANLQLGYAGIRPKVKFQGKLETDFILNTPAVHGIENYFEFLGIESPGVTASPSLAKRLCEFLF